jgi:putative endonuclease
MQEVIGSNPIISTTKAFRAFFLVPMTFTLYILYSSEVDKYYVGQTENIEERLKSHLSKISPYTSIASDWKLVYTEEYQTRTEVIKRELEIKKKKSRKYIEYLISTSPLK